MTAPDFKTTFTVDQTPEEVFNAINNVRGWWSENIEGRTDALNATFNYHYQDIHLTRLKITEFIPGKKVVWLVEENRFNFTQDETEWTGTKIIFDIAQKDGRTQLTFTHLGLVPEYECYDICNSAWSGYVNKSLYGLITTGQGKPTPKDEIFEFNEQLLQQHKSKTA